MIALLTFFSYDDLNSFYRSTTPFNDKALICAVQGTPRVLNMRRTPVRVCWSEQIALGTEDGARRPRAGRRGGAQRCQKRAAAGPEEPLLPPTHLRRFLRPFPWGGGKVAFPALLQHRQHYPKRVVFSCWRRSKALAKSPSS